MSNLLTILTVRFASHRTPGKIMASIAGQPLLAHIVARLQGLPGSLVVATTYDTSDDPIASLCQKIGVECYRHDSDPNDVVGRMAAVVNRKPSATHVMRALGDCPFLELSLVNRALHVLDRHQKDWVLWYTQPDIQPIYGSRELPVSRAAFQRIDQYARGEEREHLDLWFNRNRSRFKILYHEPPATVYFRPLYRVEVDYPDDLRLVEAIATRGPGMQAPLKEIIQWLDQNEAVAKLNWGCVEKTGPLTSYGNGLKREWFKGMKGQPVYAWDGHIWEPSDREDSPKFCQSGRCLVGWGERREGQVRTIEGHLLKGAAWLNCACGAGQFTREKF